MDLFLFTVLPAFARDCVAAGVTGVIVDWERRDKARRQAGEDTQINGDTAQDLERVRAATPGRVVVRVNGAGPWTAGEIDLAVELGADEVLLPMVRSVEQVDRALEAVRGRCGLGILVETQDAVEQVESLATRPLSRVYLGLNDLRIDRGSAAGASALFAPLVDGTVDRVRAACTMPFGVAGLTLPEAGRPVPSRLLAGELARVDAGFTFLRRSFTADVAGRSVFAEVPRILAACASAAARPAGQVLLDRAELVEAVGVAPAIRLPLAQPA